MKRSENCVNMKVVHIRFHEDALVFEFAKSKGIQGGEDHVGPWHVYVNPLNLFICPLLALARYFLTFPEILKKNAAGLPRHVSVQSLFERVSEVCCGAQIRTAETGSKKW